MEISTEIAIRENFTEEEVKIATLIGLLHDIARFKQYTEYQTFKDSISIDHGDVGIEILEENNYLRQFIKNDKYDDIIKLAIKNHNKFAIEEEQYIDKLINRFNFKDKYTQNEIINAGEETKKYILKKIEE